MLKWLYKDWLILKVAKQLQQIASFVQNIPCLSLVSSFLHSPSHKKESFLPL